MKPKLFVLTIMILCSILVLSADQTLPQVKKLPRLDLNSLEKMKPNGEYIISVWKDGRWREAGRLAYDKFLRERELDLSPFLAGGDAAKVRISEQGQGAAHIDSVLLGGRPPAVAEGRDAGRILKKLSTKDNDVLNAQGESFELAFAGMTADKTLKIAARIESSIIGTVPFHFPTENLFTRISPQSKFYSYALNSSAPPPDKVGSNEYMNAVGQRRPFFQAFAPTGSGHPAGTTYGWVSNDEKNLYVTLDFTPDNTFDGEKDYAKVYVKTGGTVKEFKVSVPERKWGTPHFAYTDKVAYEHKVYDFAIPLSEVGRATEDGRLQLAFAAYGTAAATTPLTPSLAYDPDHNRYLFVTDIAVYGSVDIVGVLLDADGNVLDPPGLISISQEYPSNQAYPDVAYDRASGRFLVVWEDSRDGPMCTDIYGQMVNADGTVYGDDFIIATDYWCQYHPAVANDSNQHRFLVVWHMAYESDVYGQLVDGEGNLVPPGAIVGARGQSTANGTSNFIVSDAAEWQANPDVAFDSLGNEYLVVFKSGSEEFGGSSSIKGQFISWDGAPLFNDTDENFLISDPAYEAVDPAIANDNVNHRFLVAWADYPGNTVSAHAQAHFRVQTALQDGDEQPFIYGQLVDTAGNLANSERLVLSDEGENPHPDESTLEDLVRSHPALDFDPFCQQYLLFYFCRWYEGDGYVGEVEGRYLNSSGGIISDYLIAASAFGDDPFENRAPATANNSVNHSFFVAWQDLWEPSNIARALFDLACAGLPEVTTAAITDITPTSAKSGGNVTSDGGAAVTSRGVCWNTAGGPSLANSHTTNGTGLGSFVSHMTGLTPNTKYFVRAYATNSVGTAYGNELNFTTLKQFKVTFVAGPGGTVSGTLVQIVPEGGNCTPVEAKADPGSCFIIWTGTTGFASTSANPLTVTNVRQDMTITANFGKLALVVEKLTEKAWIVKRYYAKIVLSVDGLDTTVPIKYVLNRKQGGGDYKPIKEFTSSDLQNNSFTHEDKFLEANTVYTYQIIAYNSSNQVIGRSVEVTVQ